VAVLGAWCRCRDCPARRAGLPGLARRPATGQCGLRPGGARCLARLPVAMKDIRRAWAGSNCRALPGAAGPPAVVLDVAHNPQAARVLADNLGDMGFHRNTWAVFGMLADKDSDGVIDALRGRVTHWLPCTCWKAAVPPAPTFWRAVCGPSGSERCGLLRFTGGGTRLRAGERGRR
jgi:hypothetical protein